MDKSNPYRNMTNLTFLKYYPWSLDLTFIYSGNEVLLTCITTKGLDAWFFKTFYLNMKEKKNVLNSFVNVRPKLLDDFRRQNKEVFRKNMCMKVQSF